MTIAELLDAYAQAGVDVYIDTAGVVRVRAAKGVPGRVRGALVDAVLLKLRHVGRGAIRAHLLEERTETVERIRTCKSRRQGSAA